MSCSEEIIERLKNPNAQVSHLVEEILTLGEREGILAFNINMKELTEWYGAIGAMNVQKLAERAGQFLTNNPEAFHDLKIFLTAQNGREIFTGFVESFEDGIIFDLAQKIGIENPIAQCQRRITAGDGI